MTPATNLRLLRRSRPRLQPGDVFVLSPSERRFLFGRVVLADLPSGEAPMPTANLIYIYAAQADAATPAPLTSLVPRNLLIPPQFVNRTPWTRGIFENVLHEPIRVGGLLTHHCFWDAIRKTYRDERGRNLRERSEPCGMWGLGSYRLIDDLVSDALHIPRAPESRCAQGTFPHTGPGHNPHSLEHRSRRRSPLAGH